MAYRFSNEDGREASARNFGRLALGLIPWALAIGASGWLGFYVALHQFRRELRSEQRSAVSVGAVEMPAALTIIRDKQKMCAGVSKAEVHDLVLRVYAINNCRVELTGMDWYFSLLAPDGTIIEEAYNSTSDCPPPRKIGDSAECVFDGGVFSGALKKDARVATVRVWTIPYSGK